MIELLNIDCMKYMATVPDKYFDLAITDPPYQNNDAIDIKNGNKHSAKRTNYHQFENIAPNKLYFDELNRVSKRWIIWGGNYFGLKGGVIVWDKNGTVFGEAEIAICNTHHSVKIFNYKWNGMLQENMKDKEIRIHPTQKPIQLYKWLLKNYAKPEFKIIDTHLGSGSSAIAVYDFGIAEFIGCEIDKDYYDAAVKRFEIYKMQQKLF
jgi:site-specific DNA-methyltransferase (adenine-specific)